MKVIYQYYSHLLAHVVDTWHYAKHAVQGRYLKNKHDDLFLLDHLPVDILGLVVNKLEWTDVIALTKVSAPLMTKMVMLPIHIHIYDMEPYCDGVSLSHLSNTNYKEKYTMVYQFKNIITYTGRIQSQSLFNHLSSCPNLLKIEQSLSEVSWLNLGREGDIMLTCQPAWANMHVLTHLSVHIHMNMNNACHTWIRHLPTSLTHLTIHVLVNQSGNMYRWMIKAEQAHTFPPRLSHLALHGVGLDDLHIPHSVVDFKFVGRIDAPKKLTLSHQLHTLYLDLKNPNDHVIDIDHIPSTLRHLYLSRVQLATHTFTYVQLSALESLALSWCEMHPLWNHHLEHHTFDENLTSLSLTMRNTAALPMIECPKQVQQLQLKYCIANELPHGLKQFMWSGGVMPDAMIQHIGHHADTIERLELRCHFHPTFVSLIPTLHRLQYLYCTGYTPEEFQHMMDDLPSSVHTLCLPTLTFENLRQPISVQHLKLNYLDSEYIHQLIDLPHVQTELFYRYDSDAINSLYPFKDPNRIHHAASFRHVVQKLNHRRAFLSWTYERIGKMVILYLAIIVLAFLNLTGVLALLYKSVGFS